MTKTPTNSSYMPFAKITVTRILSIIIIALALLAGYMNVLYQTEQRRYNRLEDMYVRVRSELGREETQRLIDLSHQKEREQFLQGQQRYDQ